MSLPQKAEIQLVAQKVILCPYRRMRLWVTISLGCVSDAGPELSVVMHASDHSSERHNSA